MNTKKKAKFIYFTGRCYHEFQYGGSWLKLLRLRYWRYGLGSFLLYGYDKDWRDI